MVTLNVATTTRYRALRLLLSVVLLSATCGRGARQAHHQTLALEPFFRELRIVRVESSAGPLNLLFDTGGGATLVTPEVARRLGCAPSGRDVGHRMSGERVEFSRCERLDLKVGRWTSTASPVAVFDVNALLPVELRTLDGVLALDAFRGRVLTIDWPKHEIRVSDGIDVPADLLPHRIATGDSGRFFTAMLPVASRGGLLWFLLDSGNIAGTLVANHNTQLLAVSTTGTVSLQVGGRGLVTLPATPAEMILDGALGTAYLLTGPVTLDLRMSTYSSLPG